MPFSRYLAVCLGLFLAVIGGTGTLSLSTELIEVGADRILRRAGSKSGDKDDLSLLGTCGFLVMTAVFFAIGVLIIIIAVPITNRWVPEGPHILETIVLAAVAVGFFALATFAAQRAASDEAPAKRAELGEESESAKELGTPQAAASDEAPAEHAEVGEESESAKEAEESDDDDDEFFNAVLSDGPSRAIVGAFMSALPKRVQATLGFVLCAGVGVSVLTRIPNIYEKAAPHTTMSHPSAVDSIFSISDYIDLAGYLIVALVLLVLLCGALISRELLVAIMLAVVLAIISVSVFLHAHSALQHVMTLLSSVST